MFKSEIDAAVAEIRKLNKAGNKQPKSADNALERAAMKRKMDAARVIEDRRIDQDE
jgi:hypothetical protein